MKTQTRDRVEVFAKHMSNEDWYPNTEILKTQQLKKKKWTTRFKTGQEIWTDTSPEKTHSWQISTWKDIQFYISSENCKLRL